MVVWGAVDCGAVVWGAVDWGAVDWGAVDWGAVDCCAGGWCGASVAVNVAGLALLHLSTADGCAAAAPAGWAAVAPAGWANGASRTSTTVDGLATGRSRIC